jgi:hypothetical protein
MCCHIYPTLPHTPSTVTNVGGAPTQRMQFITRLFSTCGSIIGVRTRDLPTRFSRSANCATGPITCWNTIPACQPDRGLSAAIYSQHVRKALSSPSPGPAIGEARKQGRFAPMITEAQLLVPDWVPTLPFTQWVSISMMLGVHLRCILLTLQLLLAPSPRVILKLASGAALSNSFPGQSRK